MKSVREIPFKEDTCVFVRYDLDVPFSDSQILDTFRLDAGLETLNFLKSKGAKIIIAGKIGRPEGKITPSLSTKKLYPYFADHLGEKNFELLENLRFDPKEKSNDSDFAKELASKADVYVNECFATSHRKDASFVGVAKLLPAFAGLRLLKEVSVLEDLLSSPKRPLTAIIGGAKLETKAPAVLKFLEIADTVLVGSKIGIEWDKGDQQNLIIPIDYVENGKDIGPNTISNYKSIIENSHTVIWSGPLGVYEEKKFAFGTEEIAKTIVDSAEFSVIGGGDTIKALNTIGLLDKINFVSTGGGAMLEFLIKGNLPGLEVLGYNAKKIS